MDELMLMKYLKSKGIEDMNEQEFIHKFKEFMRKQDRTSYMRYHNDDMDFDYPMDDMMDIKYRRGRPMKMNKLGYYDMYAEYPEYAAYSESRYGRPHSRFNTMYDGIDAYTSNTMKSMYGMQNEHFDEYHAKHIVSEMYHIENGRKHVGEKFNMAKAKEVHERYSGMIPQNVTISDVYVAINAQYHDYEELFKSWFGGNVESKIIESAIIFWFKDTDYKKGFKLTEYFKES